MPIIKVSIIEGRTDRQKKNLIESVTDAVEKSLDAPRPSIRVLIEEVPASHWGVGGIPKG